MFSGYNKLSLKSTKCIQAHMVIACMYFMILLIYNSRDIVFKKTLQQC